MRKRRKAERHGVIADAQRMIKLVKAINGVNVTHAIIVGFHGKNSQRSYKLLPAHHAIELRIRCMGCEQVFYLSGRGIPHFFETVIPSIHQIALNEKFAFIE